MIDNDGVRTHFKEGWVKFVPHGIKHAFESMCIDFIFPDCLVKLLTLLDKPLPCSVARGISRFSESQWHWSSRGNRH